MRSEAKTVAAYLNELTPERRAVVEPVLELVRANVPTGYQETMNWGMISWEVPLSVQPDTYNGQPLMFAALASQKNYISLYLTPVNAIPEFKAMLENSGKKLKMGKSCINFTRLDELPLETIAEIIRRSEMRKVIEVYERTAKRK